MHNINTTCGEIETEYRLHADLLNHTNNPDCDQSWYLQDGRLIADPSDPQKLMDPVISVSSDRLITSYCVDELHHEILCHSDGFGYQTTFRAFNGTNSISESTPGSNQIWWISALIFIVLLVLICFLLRRRIISCISRADASIFLHNDSEYRDPESGVQMNLESDESDSLNQSESEQMNGSVSRG